jgi:hypothetical protein
MWKKVVEPDWIHMIRVMQCCAEKMRFACRITKAGIQTHTQNGIMIILLLLLSNGGYTRRNLNIPLLSYVHKWTQIEYQNKHCNIDQKDERT